MACYASHLGDCSGGISKEHYISRSILETAGKVIQVTGFPWQKSGETRQVGTSALTGKFLCKRHNELLSPLDAIAKKFFVDLRTSFDEGIDDRLSNTTYEICGRSLELWLLKVLCGFLQLHHINVPKEWTELLFQRCQWPKGNGLHLFGISGNASWYFTLVRVIAVPSTDNPKHILGAKFGIGGLAMLLAFGPPRFHEPDIQSIYRPGSIVLERSGRQNIHILLWDDTCDHGSITLKVTAALGNTTDDPKPIVKPSG